MEEFGELGVLVLIFLHQFLHVGSLVPRGSRGWCVHTWVVLTVTLVNNGSGCRQGGTCRTLLQGTPALLVY